MCPSDEKKHMQRKENPWRRVTYLCVGYLAIIVQKMACRLLGARSLSEPMLE